MAYPVKTIPEELLQCFKYDENSPSGLVDLDGNAVGKIRKQGYWEVKIHGKIFKVHRIVYFINNPEADQKLDIDHLDGNKTNNLLVNLRLCEKRINSKNRKKNKNNSSGHKGISIRKIKKIHYMRCRVRVDGKLFEKYFNIELCGGHDTCLKIALEQRNRFYTKEFTERHIND